MQPQAAGVWEWRSCGVRLEVLSMRVLEGFIHLNEGSGTDTRPRLTDGARCVGPRGARRYDDFMHCPTTS